MSTETVTAISAKILIDECCRRGLSKQKLLQEIGLSPESIATPAGKVPISKMLILWDCIARYIKNPKFPFHAAAGVPFGTYRVLDYMFAASANPQEALIRSGRCFCLINNAFLLSLRLHANCAYLELHSASASTDLPRAYAQYILMNYLVRLRLVTQANLNPAEVCLSGRSQCHSQEFERGFNAPVRFGHSVNCLVFPRELMELHHPLADPELCEILEAHAKRQIQVSSASPAPLSHIYQALAHNLRDGDLTLNFLARQLAKSSRSLQREIHEHGLTFRDMAIHVRREYAKALLAQPDLPVKEIARKLQFAGASAFCRAFQRWTGVSASHYRIGSAPVFPLGASRKRPPQNRGQRPTPPTSLG